MNRRLILLVLWLSDGITYGDNLMPPPATPVKHYKLVTVSKGASLLIRKRAMTTVIVQPPGNWLSWMAPTNACYLFTSCTNLSNPVWRFRTNAPITSTKLFIPTIPGVQTEFYRAFTCLTTTDGWWMVQDLTTITNR